MNDKTPPHKPSRAERMAMIVADPQNYKICEGCDSLVTRRVATCPNCFGYRFNEDLQDIVNQAMLLGTREQISVTAEDLL